MKIYSKFIWIT